MWLNRLGLASVVLGAVTVGGFVGYVAAAQPHMQNALVDLQNAKSELSVALRNKGGHRVKALAFVERAINQVELGIGAGE